MKTLFVSAALLASLSLTACSESDAPSTVTEFKPSAEQSLQALVQLDKQQSAAAKSAATPNTDNLAEFTEGVHYRTLAQPFDADANQVDQFFWYGCPACRATEPLMQQLKADPSLSVKLHSSVLNQNWLIDALVFEAFKEFNILDKAHGKYFAARQTGEIKDHPSFIQFLSQFDISEEQFHNFSQKPTLMASFQKTQQLEQQVDSRAVPTLVIGGKYVLLNMGFSDADHQQALGKMRQAITWLSQR